MLLSSRTSSHEQNSVGKEASSRSSTTAPTSRRSHEGRRPALPARRRHRDLERAQPQDLLGTTPAATSTTALATTDQLLAATWSTVDGTYPNHPDPRRVAVRGRQSTPDVWVVSSASTPPRATARRQRARPFTRTFRQLGAPLLLQLCSDDIYVIELVVRRVEEEFGDALAVAWSQLGAQRYTSRPGRTSRREGRALIGFLDGTSNLNPRNSEADGELVFIDPDKRSAPTRRTPTPQPGGGGPYPGVGPNFPADLASVPTADPAWTETGTYMTVRVSTFGTTAWDDQSQNEQERSVGRFKVSGASLDLADDPGQTEAEPAFAPDQNNLAVPLDSHVRKSHPRRSPEDQLRRILRRGYPVIAGASGGMQRGLAFVSFAHTTSTSSSSSSVPGCATPTPQSQAPAATSCCSARCPRSCCAAVTTSYRRCATTPSRGRGSGPACLRPPRSRRRKRPRPLGTRRRRHPRSRGLSVAAAREPRRHTASTTAPVRSGVR